MKKELKYREIEDFGEAYNLTLSKILCFLAFLSALALITIIFIEYVFPLTAEGNLTYTRISGEPISQITIYVPISETGENIFKVSAMSAISAGGEWVVTPGPSGADRYPDYWILSGPPLKPGESLQVKFIMEHVRDINYEDYPWTVQADIEVSAQVTVYKHYLVTIVTILEENRQGIVLALGTLTVSLIAAAAISALIKKAPLITYQPERERPVFQEGLPAEEGECRCEKWRYVCLRFFIVDECGGKKKPSNKKEGLLKGSEYPGEGAFGDLSEEAIRKILELIDSASRIWMQCCIRLIPCVDERGKYVFKAFDPQEAPYEEMVEGIVSVPVERRDGGRVFLTAEGSYITGLCQFLSRKDKARCCRDLITRNGRKDGEKYLKFVWRAIDPSQPLGKLLEGTLLEKFRDEFKEGRSVKETFEEILKKTKDKGEKELVEGAWRNVQEWIKEKLPEKKTMEMDLLDLFSKVVDKYFFQECINIFVFGDFEDESGEREESGIATLGGRVIFLDEEVVMKNNFSTLAHEVGHNLNLNHHENQNNVMHAVCGGSKLEQDQCAKVNKHLENNKNLCDAKILKNLLHNKYGDDNSRKKKLKNWEEELRKLKNEIKSLEEGAKETTKKKALKKLEEEKEKKLKKIKQLEDEIKSLKDLEEALRKTEEATKRERRDAEK